MEKVKANLKAWDRCRACVGAYPTNHVGHTLQVRKDMKERYGVQFPLYDKIEVCVCVCFQVCC